MASAVFPSIRGPEFGIAKILIADFRCNIRNKNTEGIQMNEQGTSVSKQVTEDSGNNEVGPTEKLREHDKSQGELSIPGAQNRESPEIKDEKAPNSE